MRLEMSVAVWPASLLTKDRNWLLEADVARQYFGEMVGQAESRGWMRGEHFSVGGTRAEA